MTTALVTGASGYIGGALALALKDSGVDVRALVRRTSDTAKLKEAGIPLVYGDFSDLQALVAAVEGVEQVYHLAAITSALRARQFIEINGIGTSRLVQACAWQPTPPTLVYVSSIAASGPTSRGSIRLESQGARPVSNYGRGKRAGEVALLNACQYVPGSIIRPGIVFGEGNTELLPVFRSIYRLGSHIVPGMSPPPLSYIHIDDLIEIITRAGNRGRRLDDSTATTGRGIYFAVCPEYPNYAEFGRLLRPLLNRPLAPIMHFAQPLPWVMAWFAELVGQIRGKSLPLDLDKTREACSASWACSTRAVEKELGFEFTISLRDRLIRLIKWYDENGWL